MQFLEVSDYKILTIINRNHSFKSCQIVTHETITCAGICLFQRHCICESAAVIPSIFVSVLFLIRSKVLITDERCIWRGRIRLRVLCWERRGRVLGQ